MRLFHPPRAGLDRRGFTLTELALVLGVIGTILGAVWVASIRVGNANKAQKATAETQQILTNYRSLYSMHGVDVADGTDVTCLGVTNGYFPTDMVATGATCTASASGTTTYTGASVVSAFGGNATVTVKARTYPGIELDFVNLSQVACNNLAVGITAAPDLIYEAINTANTTLPPFGAGAAFSPATVSADCGTGNGNSVTVIYNLK